MKQSLLCVALSALALACGGRSGGAQDADAGEDGGGSDGGSNAGDGGSNGDGGWTQCTAPGGDAICGTANTPCASETANNPVCKGCAESLLFPDADGSVGVCNGVVIDNVSNAPYFCPDGYVLVANPAYLYNAPGGPNGPNGPPVGQNYSSCVHFDIAQLYAKNGWARAARYTDFSHFTGAPLPVSASCPQVSGIQLCGGPCGDSCPAGTRCTGRSPGHPYSVCIPEPDRQFCSSNGANGDYGVACFAFSVPPEDKDIIKTISYCTPTDWCRKAAANVPGGAQCDDRPGSHACFQ